MSRSPVVTVVAGAIGDCGEQPNFLIDRYKIYINLLQQFPHTMIQNEEAP